MYKFSVVIPIFNEELNLSELFYEIDKSLQDIDCKYEIITIDDASTDNSVKKIEYNKNFYDFKIRIEKNKNNLGQSYSISKGINLSNYKTIITIDADGQNDPKDIPKLLKLYFDNTDIKLVGGIRANRKDSFIKRYSSKIANYYRKKILKDDCDDTGCSLKVFDKEIFLKFPYFDGIHRFLPALYKGYGFKTKFSFVNHRERKYGISKYGTFSRLVNGLRDIKKVKRMIRDVNQYD